MRTISRHEAKGLIKYRHDLIVVETLDEKNFQDFHLPRARNVPYDDSFAEKIRDIAPDKSAPVLVYCMDAECEASSKAARKLESLGYTDVYDYEAGKVDWKAAGLPVEDSANSSS